MAAEQTQNNLLLNLPAKKHFSTSNG